MRRLFRNIEKIKEVTNPDDWWTVWFVRPLSIRFVALIQDTSITPNQVTLLSFFFVLAACPCILWGEHFGYIIAAVFLHASYVLDIADGLLARYKKQFSPFGGWIDGISDRIKEFLIIFCLSSQMQPFGLKTLFVALYSLFLLAMYHGYITKGFPEVKHSKKSDKHEGKLSKLNQLRVKLKLGFFNLGEQFFLYTVFLLINRIDLFFLVFMIYGSLSLILFSLLKYREYLREDTL